MKSLRIDISKIFIIAAIALLCIGAYFMVPVFEAHAQEQNEEDFLPLTSIPGVTSVESGDVPEFGEFVNGLFRIVIVVAAILAVIMIVIGGFQYMTTEAVGGKGEGRERITSAVLGLLLVLISVVLLSIINPQITGLAIDFEPLSIVTGPPPEDTPEILTQAAEELIREAEECEDRLGTPHLIAPDGSEIDRGDTVIPYLQRRSGMQLALGGARVDCRYGDNAGPRYIEDLIEEAQACEDGGGAPQIYVEDSPYQTNPDAARAWLEENRDGIGETADGRRFVLDDSVVAVECNTGAGAGAAEYRVADVAQNQYCADVLGANWVTVDGEFCGATGSGQDCCGFFPD